MRDPAPPGVRPPQERFSEPLARARAFVEQNGAPLDLLRADALLGAARPAEVRASLEALQREDGSFAPLPGRESCGPVRATLDALSLLAGLDVRRARSLEAGVNFLASRQEEDGGWQDERGDAAAARDLSFRVAGILARSIYARPEVLGAAGDYLADAFDEIGDRWPRLAGVCAFFSCVDHDDADRALQWAGRALERCHRVGTFSALDAARILLLSDASAMPGSDLDPRALVAGVVAEQADDGGWPAPSGDAPDGGWPAPSGDAPDGGGAAPPGERVALTLDAMEALVRLPS